MSNKSTIYPPLHPAVFLIAVAFMSFLLGGWFGHDADVDAEVPLMEFVVRYEHTKTAGMCGNEGPGMYYFAYEVRDGWFGKGYTKLKMCSDHSTPDSLVRRVKAVAEKKHAAANKSYQIFTTKEDVVKLKEVSL